MVIAQPRKTAAINPAISKNTPTDVVLSLKQFLKNFSISHSSQGLIPELGSRSTWPPYEMERELCLLSCFSQQPVCWGMCRGFTKSCTSSTSCHYNRISSLLAMSILFCSSQRGAEPSKEGGEQPVVVPPCENKVQVPSLPQQGSCG